MRRQIKSYLGVILTIALAVGMIASFNSRMASHDITNLPLIVADQHAEIEEHGHAHDEVVSVMDAYHGHAHDVADHDHNTAFLPPRISSRMVPSSRTNWALAYYAMPDRRAFDLDRPPRV
ncbi:MAG: hypothetical protein WBB25_21120 [Sulfitobacter sp.]